MKKLTLTLAAIAGLMISGMSLAAPNDNMMMKNKMTSMNPAHMKMMGSKMMMQGSTMMMMGMHMYNMGKHMMMGDNMMMKKDK